ncbi:hypothetical protein T440DRAFT_269266 [Plenodomus tracheiphilus IPT5]|uniref:Uncharacterized protein n=1 Tax=Plenodomus tracheiphilus IPT5 TaxID=1408161 RepID=A0A6A7BHG6_9PLEO|nr:hypothetical protein T440DRAFT_269266 [Plenodomus tracheiphilus IPT5]
MPIGIRSNMRPKHIKRYLTIQSIVYSCAVCTPVISAHPFEAAFIHTQGMCGILCSPTQSL